MRAAVSTARSPAFQRLITGTPPLGASAPLLSVPSCSGGSAASRSRVSFTPTTRCVPGGQRFYAASAATDYYKLLGVERGATDAEIKAAYKKQAMAHHPDRGGDEAKFKEVSRAYEVLSDASLRQAYDRGGEEGVNQQEQYGGPQGHEHVDPFDLFSQIFGFQARGRGPPPKLKTPDANYDVKLSLEEIYTGVSRNITFNRTVVCKTCDGVGGHDPETCKRCNGKGFVVTYQQFGPSVFQQQEPCPACNAAGYTIPAGKSCSSCKGAGSVKEKKTFPVDIEAGGKETLVFTFKGQANEQKGAEPGDVNIRIVAKPHKTFQRLGDDLMMVKKISLEEALCGFEFKTQFLDGEDLTVRSKPGQVMKPGDIVKVEGKGMPRPSGKPGDLLVVTEINFPDSLPEEKQKKLQEVLGGKVLDEKPESCQEARKLTQNEKDLLGAQMRQREARATGGFFF